MFKQLKILLFSLGLFFVPLLVFAYEPTLDQQIVDITVKLVVGASIWVALLTLISLTKKTLEERHKVELFWGITTPVILVTLFVAGSTIYLNIVSETNGPVHWHADFRILNCGEEIDLIDPEGISNRVGTPTFHEHDDLRVHVEGTVYRLTDVSLGSFFETIGGQVSHGQMTLPTNQGMVKMTNGDKCLTGELAGRSAKLNVFLYRTEGDKVYQEKLIDWPSHVLAPYITVPPGDCVVFEFSPENKLTTKNTCQFYAIEINKGNLEPVNFEL
jgi:hypothetical protein